MFLFDIDSLRAKHADINAQMEEQNFWEDSSKANEVLQEGKYVSDLIERYEQMYSLTEDISLMIEMAESNDNQQEASIIEVELNSIIDSLNELIENMTLEVMFCGEYDGNNAILSINSGTGGKDAQDWSQMLLRMYIRWAEGKEYTIKLLELISDPEAGIKTATIMVNGRNAYGMLKSEKGVHRLVRISPFDSSGKRHTSFASVDVMPEINEDIDVQINPSDIKVDTYRASGAGGQHINTTDSAVRITHLPTGIIVSCQNERSQHINREVAMKMLLSKLIQLKEEEQKEKIEDLSGNYNQITWGSQIRSYVFQPYKLVKDHRTGVAKSNVDAVMDGDITEFMTGYLKHK